MMGGGEGLVWGERKIALGGVTEHDVGVVGEEGGGGRGGGGIGSE